MADRIEYALKTPVKLGELTVNSLSFRKPKGKDFRHLPTVQTMEPIFKLASVLSGQPSILFDELEAEDFAGIMEIVSNFMPGGGATGNGQS